MSNLQSVITDDLDHCIISGSPNVAIHHCFEGTANRRISDRDHLVVPLEPKLHNEGSRPATGIVCDVHHCRNMATLMHMVGQLAWEREFLLERVAFLVGEEKDDLSRDARNSFLKIYGRNYL